MMPDSFSIKTMLWKFAVVCLLAGLASRPGCADDGKRFDYQAITLDNGLQVISLEDFSCPIVAVNLWYHVGSKDEDPERQGFAHMFEHMMFRGTDRLGSPIILISFAKRVATAMPTRPLIKRSIRRPSSQPIEFGTVVGSGADVDAEDRSGRL